MAVSRKLKETISDIPKCIDDSIVFTKTEKWEASKVSLLGQKKEIEKVIAAKQSQLDEIDNLLLMFEPKIETGE